VEHPSVDLVDGSAVLGALLREEVADASQVTPRPGSLTLAATAWAASYRERSDPEPTRRASRQLAREARRLLADGRPLDVVRRAVLLLVLDAAGPRLLSGAAVGCIAGGHRVTRAVSAIQWTRRAAGTTSSTRASAS
jgi:hypothetical protein